MKKIFLIVFLTILPSLLGYAEHFYSADKTSVASKLGTSFDAGFRFLVEGKTYSFFWGASINDGGDYFTFLFKENQLIAVNRIGQDREKATQFDRCISAVASANSTNCLREFVDRAVLEKLEEKQFENLKLKYGGWKGPILPSVSKLNQVTGWAHSFFEKTQRKVSVPEVGDQINPSAYSDKSNDFLVLRADKVVGEKAAIGVRGDIVEWVYFCGQNAKINSALCGVHSK